MTDLVGKSLGRYHILEQLGEGGMATVYKAFDTRLERDVAVKVLRTELFGKAMLERILKRFEREAKALAKLSHPNIVKVHDYGEHEGSPYLVMEYLPGGTLKQRMGKPVPWQETTRLLLPVAEALSYAHEHNILHRDVKPANILLAEKGQPLLSDFGIAKILDLDDGQTLTAIGVGIGTPEYMSPEQGMGQPVDPGTDVYSLGVVLYELITGRKPFQADTPMAVVVKHLNDPLPRPTQFVPGLPEKVEKVLLKALAKKPEDRYLTMGDFTAALENLTSGAAPEPVKAVAKTIAAVEASDTQETMDDLGMPEKTAPTTLQPPSRSTPAMQTNRAQVPSSPPVPDTKQINWKPVIIGAGGLIVLAAVVWGGWQLSKGGPLVPGPSATRTFAPTATLTNTPQELPTSIAPPTLRPTFTPQIPPTAKTLQWEFTDPKGVLMRPVAAGPFTMGSESGASDEAPAHTVTLDNYYMDVYEVTNAQYAACVDAGGCTPPYSTSSYTRSSYFRKSTYLNFPVINMDWNQAKAYCEWRGARLPTEAEWEKAARGTDGRIYPWGNTAPSSSLANFNDNVGDTTEVGSYEGDKSPYGMYDMAGNVSEWVNDWDGPSGYYRVLRGGSWSGNESGLRSSNRNSSNRHLLDAWNFRTGFRCARSAQGDLLQLAKDEGASLEVLNGTYTAGLAGKTGDYLKSLGLNVASVGNPDKLGYPRTVIIDHSGKPSMMKYLTELFKATSPSSQIQIKYDSASTADVTVILGDDWAYNNPMP